MITRTVRSGRADLALHELRPANGGTRPLLLLHGLGERSPAAAPSWTSAWAGPVHALDFTGHGSSSVPAGGGYTCEALMGDVDSALATLGPSTIVGRGLGAYVALLIAGARPELVRGAVLADGPGLAGGGPVPPSPYLAPDVGPRSAPDPLALAELSRDVRPPDYAFLFLTQALTFSGLANPVTVAAVIHPPWLAAIVGEPGVDRAGLSDALDAYGDPA